MMWDWQTVVAAFIVAGAAGIVVRRVWMGWRGRSTGCHGCARPCTNERPTLIEIGVAPTAPMEPPPGPLA